MEDGWQIPDFRFQISGPQFPHPIAYPKVTGTLKIPLVRKLNTRMSWAKELSP